MPRLSSLSFAFAIVVSAVEGTAAWADDRTMRIAALIKQLGDDDFHAREQAGKELETYAEAALPAVRKAATEHDDPEVCQRARQAYRAIVLANRHSKSTGLKMAFIAEGQFGMGSTVSERTRRLDEVPHTVRITRPYLMGVYEITQEEYVQVVGFNPSWFSPAGGGKAKLNDDDAKRYPVDQVTWFEAIEFCNRLSEKDKYPPYYVLKDVQRSEGRLTSAAVSVVGGNGYRLPTEAEWEYAARAGTATRFSFGDAPAAGVGNFRVITTGGYGGTEHPSYGRTGKVGAFKPNHWGLYDVHGNVGEWCWDWYDKDYYSKSPAADPTGPETGHHRVQRGGSWLVSDASCRSASRFYHTPDEAKNYAGFRIARTP